MVLLFALNLHVSAAMFSTSPAMLQANSKNVKIIFDASQSGVAALKSASVLYAHIGVTLTNNPGVWTHVIGDWNSNTENKKFTKNSNGLWELNIGDIATYFGITDPSETVAKIAVIARTADGKSQTNDNFIDVYGDGFQMILTADSPLVIDSKRDITFSIATTENASLSLSIDGKTVKTAENVTSLSASQTFGTLGAFNTVKATATNGTTTLIKELTVAYPGESPVKAYPGGTPKQGAVRNADGTVTFCLAAPQKKSVMLIGEWDDYNPTAHSLMNRQDVDGVSYFWTTTTSPLTDNEYHRYYYLVDNDTPVADPYARLILDPWNDRSIPQGCFDDMPQYPYDLFSDKVLAIYRSDIDDYDWDETTLKFEIPDHRSLNIYEILLRDFTGDGSDQGGKSFGTFKSAKNKIGYLRDLGINAVELMPVMEFSGNNSWGYNPNFYMALDKTYGSPEDMRDFVAECHRNGIAVILDIVLNHSDGLNPWYQMYKPGSSPFYNAYAPHSYSVLNDWNQDYKPVTDHWADVLTYWMEAYKVDGFRFDLVKGLGSNSSYKTGGDSNTNCFNQSRVDRMKQLHAAMSKVNPKAIHINELLGEPAEDNANGSDGQMGWANVNSNSASYAKGVGTPDMRGFYSTEWGRNFGVTVDYAESHDEKRIARAIIESGHSTVKYTAGAEPSEAAIKRLGAVAAHMLVCPGAKMVWQFGETAADDHQGSDLEKLRAIAPRWNDLQSEGRKALHDVYRSLLHLRLKNQDIFTSPDTKVTLGGFSSALTQVRYATVRNGDKEIVALFNPDVTGTAKTITAPVASITPANAQLIATSWKTEPQLRSDAAGMASVNLAPGEFCVYASAAVTGDDSPEIDKLNPGDNVRVYNLNGAIAIDGEYQTARAFSIDGIEVPLGVELPAGVYIITVDGTTHKLAI